MIYEQQNKESVLSVTPKTGILKKIVAIQSGCTAIQKNGTNTHFRYTYYKLEDILAMLNPLLNQHGVTIFHSVDSVRWDESNGMVIVTMQHTITDCDSGDSVSVYYTGTGKDEPAKGSGGSGIGSKAIYKAITSTTRYFYMGMFRIADVFDEDEHHEPKQSEPKRVEEQPKKEPEKFSVVFTRTLPLSARELRQEVRGYMAKPLKLTEEQHKRGVEVVSELMNATFPIDYHATEILKFLTGVSTVAELPPQALTYLAKYLQRDEGNKLQRFVNDEIANIAEYLDNL